LRSPELAVDYPVKTPRQLRPLLVGFRKAAGLTQAQVAARLGVTQQTYAQLEAKPESASIDRLFRVLKILKASIVLTQAAAAPAMHAAHTPGRAAPVKPTAKAAQGGAAKKRGTLSQATPPASAAKTGSTSASGRGAPKPAAARKRAAPPGAATRKREDW
jgi:HTH-type transcriptional regulator/antitoxin HipB